LPMVQLMPPPSPSSLASFKSRAFLPFWYRLTQVVLEKRPLNGCSVAVSQRFHTDQYLPQFYRWYNLKEVLHEQRNEIRSLVSVHCKMRCRCCALDSFQNTWFCCGLTLLTFYYHISGPGRSIGSLCLYVRTTSQPNELFGIWHADSP